MSIFIAIFILTMVIKGINEKFDFFTSSASQQANSRFLIKTKMVGYMFSLVTNEVCIHENKS